MKRVQIPIERIKTLYALAGAVNDATDDFAVSISLDKYDAYVHITEMRDGTDTVSVEYIYAPNYGHDNYDEIFRADDENLTKGETALVEILEMLNNDR